MGSSGGSGGGVVVPVIAGTYYPATPGYTNGSPLNANYGYATPLVVDVEHTFTGIGVNIAAAGVGGAPVMRMAVYNDNGSGYPGSLVQDCGTVDVTGTGGKEVTGLTIKLSPGLYWLVCSPQGATTTQPTPRIANSTIPPFGDLVPQGGNPNTVYTSSSVASFPTGSPMAPTFPAGAVLDNNAYTALLA